MKTHLEFILIDVKQVKKGFVVLVDNMFGTVSKMSATEVTIDFTNSESKKYPLKEISGKVVKFLAKFKDKRTIPIIHGDFNYILKYLSSSDDVRERFIKNNVRINLDGSITTIQARVEDNDIVEIIDLPFIDKHGIHNRADRLGVIEERISIKFAKIKLNSGNVHKLKRTQFSIVGRDNSKQLFKLDY